MARGERQAMAKLITDIDKSEKITINVGVVDLGHIDLLVDEGFFANRTDFIRTAIRRQLETRSSSVDRTVARRGAGHRRPPGRELGPAGRDGGLLAAAAGRLPAQRAAAGR